MLKYDQKYITFDCETESLNLRYARPWELSYIISQGNSVIRKKQLYIDIEGLYLKPFIKKLCGFDQKLFDQNKIAPDKAWDEFKELLYDPSYKLVGQNILKYDIHILAVLAEICGEDIDFSFIDRILDTRPLALAEKNNLEKPRKGDIVQWQYKVLNDRSLKGRVSQKMLLKYFGIEHDKELLHNGLYDCEMTWEIFKQLRKILEL